MLLAVITRTGCGYIEELWLAYDYRLMSFWRRGPDALIKEYNILYSLIVLRGNNFDANDFQIFTLTVKYKHSPEQFALI